MKMIPAKNGLILQDEDGFTLYQEPDGDDESDELDRFAEFLWHINDNYGPTTSRYSPKRIVIKIEPGDKYEDAPSA